MAGPLTDFLVVFAVIGLFELGDRTNFFLIGLAAKGNPTGVWIGAAAAFVVTTVLAVLIGGALLVALGGNLFYLRLGGGVFLVLYAVYLALVPEANRIVARGKTAMGTAFAMIMILELGDTTMILVIVFVGSFGNLLIVGVAASLALVLVAASASYVGARLGARVEPKALDRLVVIILGLVGLVTILYAVAPGLFPAFLR